MGRKLIKLIIAIFLFIAVFLFLNILITLQKVPNLTMTAIYPSIVYKPSDFEVQFTLRNSVVDTLVINTINIESGKIIQLDNIPSDCQVLTDQENICDEALSFRVTNTTATGLIYLKFKLYSDSKLNWPILKKFIEVSHGEGSLQIPINVETLEIKRLTSQSIIGHERVNVLILISIAFILSFISFTILLALLFIPEIYEFFTNFF